MKVIRQWKTCDSFPAQWDVWDENGNYAYVRYRWGVLTVDVAADEHQWHLRKYIAQFSRDFGQPNGGVMETMDMCKYLEEFNYTQPVETENHSQ